MQNSRFSPWRSVGTRYISNSDANASMNNQNLNESSASSHCEKTWMPRGTDKISGSECLPQPQPQSQSHHQTPIEPQPQSGIQMLSPQFKKRKREATVGPESGEPNFFSQGHPASQSISPSSRTTTPSLSSNSTANGVKATEEVRSASKQLETRRCADTPTQASDTVIGSDIILPNQPSGTDTTRSVDPGTISDSKANNVVFEPSGDVPSATVHRKFAQSDFEPLPVNTQPSETIPVPNHHQSTTPVDPRRDPRLMQQVGNVLQNLVATTSIDSRLVLRFSKDLYASKKELRRWEANGASNAIVPEQSAVGPHSNHVNQTHIDPSISSALVEKLSRKDHEISCLVQELRTFRERYGAVVQAFDAERSQLHSVLSAKENETKILVERNRHLEVQLSAMQTEKTQITNHCRSLELTLNKYANNNHPGPLNFPTQLCINSPTTPGTPISPINQQSNFPYVPSHPIRRESISTMSTTPRQGREQGMPPPTRTALMAPVPKAKAMPRAGSNGIQLYEQQGYVPIPPGSSSSHVEMNHQFQRMELAGQHHHPQPPGYTPPPLSQVSSAQHQQLHQVFPVAQYQKQPLDKQNVAQDQPNRHFEHAHRSQQPEPPNYTIPPISRKQLLALHVDQAHPPVHEQTTRRHSEPVITHGTNTNIKRGTQRSRIVSNQYPGDQRPPPIYAQLPASQVYRPTPVNTIATQPLNLPPPGPSKVPLSYMAESFRQSSVQPIHQEVQKSVVPMPHTGDTEMQQPFSRQSQMQVLPIKQGTQSTEIYSSLSIPSEDSRFVIDLTLDEDQINANTDGPPKKRLKVDRDKDVENQSAPLTPSDLPAPSMVVVDDVKVETENEPMTMDVERVAERHTDVPYTSPNTLSNPSNELPVQSSIIHGIDTSNPEVVDHLNDAFVALSEEDHSLRYCFYCQFRCEGDPADCPEITRLKDPTIEEILNHLREEHSTVFEAIRSGNYGGEQDQVQVE